MKISITINAADLEAANEQIRQTMDRVPSKALAMEIIRNWAHAGIDDQAQRWRPVPLTQGDLCNCGATDDGPAEGRHHAPDCAWERHQP